MYIHIHNFMGCLNVHIRSLDDYLYIGRVFFDSMEVGRVIQCTQHEIWLIYVKYVLATLSLMLNIIILVLTNCLYK